MFLPINGSRPFSTSYRSHCIRYRHSCARKQRLLYTSWTSIVILTDRAMLLLLLLLLSSFLFSLWALLSSGHSLTHPYRRVESNWFGKFQASLLRTDTLRRWVGLRAVFRSPPHHLVSMIYHYLSILSAYYNRGTLPNHSFYANIQTHVLFPYYCHCSSGTEL